MAGNASLVYENAMLQLMVGKDPQVTRYVGLLTVICDEDGVGGTEASAGNYERKSTAHGDWEAAAAGAIQNGNDITFIECAAGNWGTIVGVAIYEDASGGDMICWCDLAANKVVDIGDTFRLAAGDLDLTCT